MSTSRTETRFFAALLVAMPLACAGAPKAAPGEAKALPQNGVERWLPLTDKTVFAYDTLAEPSGEKGMLVLEIRRPAQTRAELVVAGRIQRVDVDPSGVRHAAGGFLLKEPFSVGAKFPGDFGEVEITSLTQTAKVPAGSFTGCLETVESAARANATKRTRTVFCPGVGITFRRTEAESDEGNGAESLALKSYGPKFEIDFK